MPTVLIDILSLSTVGDFGKLLERCGTNTSITPPTQQMQLVFLQGDGKFFQKGEGGTKFHGRGG